MTEIIILGRQRFVAFTTEPNQKGYATTLIDRVGPTFQCFDSPAEIGSDYVCAQILSDSGVPSQELRARVVRVAELDELKRVLKQHPNSKRLKLHPGYWYKIHAD